MAAPIELDDGSARPPEAHLRGELLYVGTATVVLSFGGFTVLTDPNFLHQGEHARLGYGLRSRRRTEPAMAIEDLPPIDLVVLSHHHGDHFDDRVVRSLRKDLPIVTTPHAAAKLARQGFTEAIALDTWDRLRVARRHTGDELVVTALPGRHAPGPLVAALPPVMGSMLEYVHAGEPTLRVYVTGDTLLHDRLAEIPRRYPDIHLALLHLGGTRILGVTLTMDADQGVEALRLVRPRHAVPIHTDDYTVFRSSLRDFLDAADQAGLATQVHPLAIGERLDLDVVTRRVDGTVSAGPAPRPR